MATEDIKPTEPVIPPAGTPEYNEFMAAKFDKSQGIEPNKEPEVKKDIPAKPEGVPDKFYNKDTGEVDYAALTKSYTELEKKASKPAEPKKDEPAVNNADKLNDAVKLAQLAVDEAKTKAEAEGATDADKAKLTEAENNLVLAKADVLKAASDNKAAEEAKKLVDSKGLDFDAMSDEYAETGELSKETRALLESKGIPEFMVDQFINGQEAIAANLTNQAYEIVGGQEKYTEITEWAKAALKPEELTAYNEAVSTDSIEKIKLAVEGLHAKFIEANGQEPNLLGGKAGVTAPAGYSSRAEMTKDMKDERYAKDPAFRQMVEQKVAKTTAF